jgi:hypothetical protein
MLPKEALEAQRKHPIASWSLLVATLTPMVIGITGLGFLMKHLFPSPTGLVILAGGCLFIAAIAPLGFLGAFGWLLLARSLVPRRVARAFFIYPGLGILSRVSERMFLCVYGRADE